MNMKQDVSTEPHFASNLVCDVTHQQHTQNNTRHLQNITKGHSFSQREISSEVLSATLQR